MTSCAPAFSSRAASQSLATTDAARALLLSDRYPWNDGQQITIPRGRFGAAVRSVTVVPIIVTSGGSVYVRGRVGGTSGVFLFDTGAPYAVVNTRVVSLGTPVDSTRFGDGVGNTFFVYLHRLDTLTWGGVSLHDVGVIGVDLRQAEAADGEPLLGIISMAQLKPFLAVLDYHAQQLCLHTLNDRGEPITPPRAFADASRVPIVVTPRRIFARAAVGDMTVYLLLDTGDQINVMTQDAARTLGAHLQPTGETKMMVGSSGASVPVSMERIDRLVLGEVVYDTLPVAVGAYAAGRDGDHPAPGQIEAGGLGTAFFSPRPVAINLQRRLLYLWRERGAHSGGKTSSDVPLISAGDVHHTAHACSDTLAHSCVEHELGCGWKGGLVSPRSAGTYALYAIQRLAQHLQLQRIATT